MNRIKPLTIVALAAAMLLATACKKDGVYRPDKKLSRISEYQERVMQRYDSEEKLWKTIQKDSTARRDAERWTWDGNLLHHIDVYRNGAKVSTVAFIYDGKRLVRTSISNTQTLTKNDIEYEYDGRRLKTMTHKNNKGETIATETFEYDGKKISRLTFSLTGASTKAEPALGHALALQAVIGDAIVARDIVEACRKDNGSKASETVWDFEWKDDNIRSVTNRTSGSKTTYRYDDKSNPLRGLLATLCGIGDTPNEYAFSNRNNIISADIDGQKESYSYTYSTDLPSSRSQSIVDHYTQGYRYVYTYIDYYEYVED